MLKGQFMMLKNPNIVTVGLPWTSES